MTPEEAARFHEEDEDPREVFEWFDASPPDGVTGPHVIRDATLVGTVDIRPDAQPWPGTAGPQVVPDEEESP